MRGLRTCPDYSTVSRRTSALTGCANWVSLAAEAAARFAEGFGDKRVAIHGGHGIFTTGQSVDEAAW